MTETSPSKAVTEVKTVAATKRHDATDFKLVIPRSVMDKINWWMHKTDKEVSGFGSLTYDEKTQTFKVRDAILLKQEVGAASAEIDPAAMAKAMYLMKDDPNGLKWHWHSHVNMGVFWSSDDMEIIRSLGQRSWVLATVFNYREEHRTAYLTQVKIKDANGGETPHDIFVDEIQTDIVNFVSEDLYKQWDAEYAANVTELSTRWSKDWAKDWNDDKTADEVEEERRLTTADRIREQRTYLSGYDKDGYANAPDFPGGSVYNPFFDQNLKTEEEKLIAAMDLTPMESDYLMLHSPIFKETLKGTLFLGDYE